MIRLIPQILRNLVNEVLKIELDFSGIYPDHKTFMLSDCYVHVYKSILMLGNDKIMNQQYIKISFFSVMVGGMILYWLWEAMLITYFSFPTMVLPFNNIKEFVEKTDLKVK